MHDVVLVLHSWVRWVAIAAGVLATVSSFGRGPSRDRARPGLIFTIALDVQFLLGVILLFNLRVFFSDFAATMQNPIARFYTVEHETIMIGAIVLAHVGRVLARRTSSPESARTRELVFYGLSTLLLIVGTPWPGTRDYRPLFRI